MQPCMACGKPAEEIRALEVRTLHVRGAGGEQRVQALGRMAEGAVCADCARRQLELERRPAAAAGKRTAVYGAILAAGAVLALTAGLLPSGQNIFRILGLAAVVCGALGIWSALRDARERAAALAALPEAEALEEAAFDVFRDHAPRKEGENDLTYIPVNAVSLRRKNGDLMVLYKLMPEIAVEAWKRLHPEAAQPAGEPAGAERAP